jgi:hypothetical protein
VPHSASGRDGFCFETDASCILSSSSKLPTFRRHYSVLSSSVHVLKYLSVFTKDFSIPFITHVFVMNSPFKRSVLTFSCVLKLDSQLNDDNSIHRNLSRVNSVSFELGSKDISKPADRTVASKFFCSLRSQNAKTSNYVPNILDELRGATLRCVKRC